MLKKKLKINLLNGFHIRPATKFVKETKKFFCDIKIKFNNKIVDAKSLFKIQTLGINNGDIITIITKGKDEIIALKHLSNFINLLK